jgi:hypothetical protein
VAVAAADVPAEGAEFGFHVAQIADARHPGVGLDLVVVDHHHDLAQPAVGRRRQSCSSPSPVRTKMRRGFPARRLASAIPLALEMPMPSEPVLAWI